MKRGEIYRFALDPTLGSEQRKTRMCLVVRRDAPSEAAEARNPTTIVTPLADANGKQGNVLNALVPRGVGGTTKDSLILIAQLRAVDKRCVAGGRVGELPSELMDLVSAGIKAVLALD